MPRSIASRRRSAVTTSLTRIDDHSPMPGSPLSSRFSRPLITVRIRFIACSTVCARRPFAILNGSWSTTVRQTIHHDWSPTGQRPRNFPSDISSRIIPASTLPTTWRYAKREVNFFSHSILTTLAPLGPWNEWPITGMRYLASDRKSFSGVSGLCSNQYGKIIGDQFPTDPFDTSPSRELLLYRLRGEKWGSALTEIVRRNPFPEIAKELISRQREWFGWRSRKITRLDA